jgi:phage/plasmid-associated DNA primase
MRLIPFTQRFDGKGADPKLPEKLRDELPGILAWAVAGAVEWYQNGLGTAAAVERATSEYCTETNVVERFLSETCVTAPELQVTKQDMYTAYEEWCEDENEEPKTPKAFTTVMNERGVVKGFYGDRSHGKRIWRGIALREDGGGETPSSEKSVSPHPSRQSQNGTLDESGTRENPCKQGGSEESGCHISPENEKYPGNTPRVEKVLEKGPKSGTRGKSGTRPFTTPVFLESDGLRIEYMPEGE